MFTMEQLRRLLINLPPSSLHFDVSYFIFIKNQDPNYISTDALFSFLLSLYSSAKLSFPNITILLNSIIPLHDILCCL